MVLQTVLWKKILVQGAKIRITTASTERLTDAEGKKVKTENQN